MIMDRPDIPSDAPPSQAELLPHLSSMIEGERNVAISILQMPLDWKTTLHFGQRRVSVRAESILECLLSLDREFEEELPKGGRMNNLNSKREANFLTSRPLPPGPPPVFHDRPFDMPALLAAAFFLLTVLLLCACSSPDLSQPNPDIPASYR